MREKLRPTSGHYSSSQPILDGLIVLGAPVNPQGRPGRVARLRLKHALHLWRGHCPEKVVLLTGGRRPGAQATEARAMADWALSWVEENWGREAREQLAPCLVLEEASLNTAASAANTLPLAQALELAAVGLVSDALHIRRAHFLFRRRFSPAAIAVLPLPVPGVLGEYWRRGRYLWLSKMALREGGAWLKVLAHLALRKDRG